MASYGVTEQGFELKRLDTILEEIHRDLTEGFGIDTRVEQDTFLNVLVTTLGGQLADLWEVAQESYYAKFPASAYGINLDNAVQFGGIRRTTAKQSIYQLHCKGVDGTKVVKDSLVASDTNPQRKLFATNTYEITRSDCNEIAVVVSALENATYTITINSVDYSVQRTNQTIQQLLQELSNKIPNDYEKSLNNEILVIKDTIKSRSSTFELSENLTTSYVVSIASYTTEEYGKIKIPNGLIKIIVDNIVGLTSISNLIEPTLGRDLETDIELRHTYLAQSAVRSVTSVDSIIAQLNKIDGVVATIGFENDTDSTDAHGLAPHSIMLVVEGGDETTIAKTILKYKTGGIQTNGEVVVNVPGRYGDSIPIKFDRPTYKYLWVKVVLHGDTTEMESNYEYLAKQSIQSDCDNLAIGDSLYIQKLNNGIYNAIGGLTYVDIEVAITDSAEDTPSEEEYSDDNVIATITEHILSDVSRIEVGVYGT